MAKNEVVAGEYIKKTVTSVFGTAYIYLSSRDSIQLTKETVDSYELVTDEHRKSASSAVARGLLGGVLLGPVGLLAGGLSAKNKGTYTVAITFKDGSSSLLEIDDKIYKLIVSKCF